MTNITDLKNANGDKNKSDSKHRWVNVGQHWNTVLKIQFSEAIQAKHSSS